MEPLPTVTQLNTLYFPNFDLQHPTGRLQRHRHEQQWPRHSIYRSKSFALASSQQTDNIRFYDQEAYSDVTIRFGDHAIKCHKLVLAKGSKVLARMLDCSSGFKVCLSFLLSCFAISLAECGLGSY